MEIGQRYVVLLQGLNRCFGRCLLSPFPYLWLHCTSYHFICQVLFSYFFKFFSLHYTRVCGSGSGSSGGSECQHFRGVVLIYNKCMSSTRIYKRVSVFCWFWFGGIWYNVTVRNLSSLADLFRKDNQPIGR